MIKYIVFFLTKRIMESKVVEHKYVKFKSSIKDWGLSHATLEEVFMKLTSGKNHS